MKVKVKKRINREEIVDTDVKFPILFHQYGDSDRSNIEYYTIRFKDRVYELETDDYDGEEISLKEKKETKDSYYDYELGLDEWQTKISKEEVFSKIDEFIEKLVLLKKRLKEESEKE